MDFQFGSQTFRNVQVPILWGTRAILSHPTGVLSIINIGGETAKLEVIGDSPSNDVEYSEKEDGFVIYDNDQQVYFYSPARKLIRDMKGELPECELKSDHVRIGTNKIGNSMVSGFQVGIGVSSKGFFVGGPLPKGLAELKL
jgi:hypothetical protein